MLFLQNNADFKTNRNDYFLKKKILESQLFIFNKKNNGE